MTSEAGSNTIRPGETGAAGAASERLHLEVGRLAAAGSLQGPAHRVNEDTWRIAEPADRATAGRLYLVADGVGGRSRGEVASALAAEITVEQFFNTEGDALTRLLSAVREANRQVSAAAAAQSDATRTMATTIVAAAVADGAIALAHAGDSRCYLVIDQTVTQLTHDHSWVQEQVDRGAMTPAEARQSTRRNIITRALGLGDGIEADTKTVVPAAAPGRLVLCSDGVHGVIEDDELLALISGVEARVGVERVLAKVEERAGRDDATIVIAELSEIAGAAASDVPAHGGLFGWLRKRIHRPRSAAG
ncbi:MAG TPA: protein phosphatase 2C domain-containing protein [Dehalococcoidia bacterium]